VPVPPPMPAVMNSMSAPATTLPKSSTLSCAACSPRLGLPPVPSPRVSCVPICSLFGQMLESRACLSVLMAQNSTFCSGQGRQAGSWD
jgi:hypothetical protein